MEKYIPGNKEGGEREERWELGLIISHLILQGNN